jgi:hypothetical protein
MIDGVEVITDLQAAYDGSYYFIAGAGGDLGEWVNGYNAMMREAGIGEPVQWYVTTGDKINDFAFPTGWLSVWPECFQSDLRCLMFPLTDLHGGKLPLFKLQAQDRWFDDVIQNMRRRNG